MGQAAVDPGGQGPIDGRHAPFPSGGTRGVQAMTSGATQRLS